MDYPTHVHVENVVPVLERVRVDFTGNPNAGIVEQVVDPPGMPYGLADCVLEVRIATHIEFDRMRLPASFFELLRQLLRLADLPIGDPHFTALSDQLGR